MFSKKRIINYSYVNTVQTNGSVIKLFNTISSKFITDDTFYLKFNTMSNILKKKKLLKVKNLFFIFFSTTKNHFFFNKLRIFFLIKNKKKNYNYFNKTLLFKKTILIFNVKKKKIKKNKEQSIKEKIELKKKVDSENFECTIFNNAFIVSILNKYSKKVIFNLFFNI